MQSIRPALRIPFLAAIIATLMAAQSGTEPAIALEVAPYGTTETRAISVPAKASVSVTAAPQSQNELVPAIYIFSDDQVIAKNDEQADTTAFAWSTPTPRIVSVAITSKSPTPTTYRVTVGPANATRAPASNANVPGHLTYRVFFATDRAPAADIKYSPYFGGEPSHAESLTFGVCEVSIPRDHRMGRLEAPTIWRLEFKPDPEKHVVVETVRSLSSELFFSEIKGRVSSSARKEALVFVHGFNTTFEAAARRTAQIAYDLQFDGATILYSWPSQGSLSPVAYNKDGRNAELTVDRLKNLLEQVVAETGAQRIHIIAHSMGTRVVARALTTLAAGRTSPIPQIRHVALMAPDIDVDLFRKMAQEFQNAAGNVTLYASERDQALVAAQLFAGYPRAGQGGNDLVVIKGIDTVDASSVDTSLLGVLHQYYADSKTILSDIFNLVRDTPPKGRFGLRSVQSQKGQYWLFAQ